jgi:hypothetical protein
MAAANHIFCRFRASELVVFVVGIMLAVGFLSEVFGMVPARQDFARSKNLNKRLYC